MCDDHDLETFRKEGISRRKFSVLVAGTGLGFAVAGCATAEDGAKAGLTESMITVDTADGTMDAFFVHPARGASPAVIIWPDIAGLRDAFKIMARRLAGEGYAVLVANPYYRNVPAPQFADFDEFRAEGGFQKVGPWRAAANAEAIMRDTTSLIGYLDAQDAVDETRGVGAQGYCMGGPFTIWSAAGVPGRMRAAASFHGGGLVGDAETAPINLFDDINANLLIAIAENDDAKAPDDKTKLRAAADAEGVDAEIEVYAADHGWTVYDSPAYNEDEGERAWARLLALYKTSL